MSWLLSHPWWDDEHYWFEKGVFHKGRELYVHDHEFDLDPVTLVTKPLAKDGWLGWDDVIGGTMMVWGTAMLVPGPVDFSLAVLGTALAKHPYGGVAAVAAYNIFASFVFLTGLYLVSLD